MSFLLYVHGRIRPFPLLATTLILATLALAACHQPAAVLEPSPTRSPAPPPLRIIPAPASVSLTPTDTFYVTGQTQIVVDTSQTETERIGRYLASLIGNTAETTPPVVEGTGSEGGRSDPPGSIVLALRSDTTGLGAEGYALTITPSDVRIEAGEPAGLFYGVQTLRHLLPAAVEYTAAYPQPLGVPVGTIVDRPRFEWRGAMLDVARHFFPADDVKRLLDLMALYKMNRLHLHLTDDQGWRIEIPGWPNLTAYGATTQVGGGPGGYYTQEEYADLVLYAENRFITVVPEVDVPGHTNAALASYPELTCDGTAPPLFTGIAVGFSALCVEKARTYEFFDDVVREIARLTPGPYFHLGGDETRTLTEEQYRHFMARAQRIVASHGKRVVGWDEIAGAEPLPGTLIQVWRPHQDGVAPEALTRAVAAGASLILSPADRVYLDMKYDSTTVLGLSWAGYNDVRDAYDWEPSDLLSGVPEESIAGVEAPLWSETLGSRADVEFMAFPRLVGVAELGWSPHAATDWGAYRSRLAAQAPRWSVLGVNFFRSPLVPWTRDDAMR